MTTIERTWEMLQEVRAQRRQAQPDAPDTDGVTLDDFRAFMPTHSYLFVPTRQMWAAGSVNSRIPPQILIADNGQPVLGDNGEPKTISASAWLDRNRPVEQMTWAPGLPMIIEGRLISEGGWIEHGGVKCFNLYRAPTIVAGSAAEAGPWLDHMRCVFGNDAEHLLDWLAHRVQRPADKINHAIVLGGRRASAKTPRLSRSSGRSVHGTSWKCRHTTCSVASTAS
jgi:hypothetical protein